ncbi:hypothetical protein RRG08_034618 [Elysia crispata]|uniref:Uncharacterized protein n=1 Tax=Elysia crispata TaxID=231223 RepID=A0AAE1E9P0_9GAST|nr:hypothetical protein RRG08_034618 [Elysia crispata]
MITRKRCVQSFDISCYDVLAVSFGQCIGLIILMSVDYLCVLDADLKAPNGHTEGSKGAMQSVMKSRFLTSRVSGHLEGYSAAAKATTRAITGLCEIHLRNLDDIYLNRAKEKESSI